MSLSLPTSNNGLPAEENHNDEIPFSFFFFLPFIFTTRWVRYLPRGWSRSRAVTGSIHSLDCSLDSLVYGGAKYMYL